MLTNHSALVYGQIIKEHKFTYFYLAASKVFGKLIIIIIIIISKIVDLAVPADHRINLKESEKKDKYLSIARELKKLWNMKVKIVPIVIGALGTITKGLLKGLKDLEDGGLVETIQTTTLVRTARILRRVLETWRDLLSLLWKTTC